MQYATASALNNQEATATFLLLPNWMENSTNAFHKTCTDNKDVCTILENIPKEKVRYMSLLLYQQSKTPPLPEAIWGIRILVVWNKAAREQLIANNPSWFEKMKQDLSPAAIWNFKTASTIPSLKPPTERILPKMAKIDKLPKESRNKVINAMPSARCLFTSPVFLNLVVLCRHQSTQAFLPSFFPMLDLLVYVLPFFSSTWLPPLLSFISSSRPLLLPFYLSTFSSFQPRSREFAISPWPM